MSEEAITLRTGHSTDAGEIARLAGVLGYEATAEEMEKRLRDLLADGRYLILVAASGDQLLGWINGERRLSVESGTTFEIVGLVVDPAARRRGVGNALIAAIERWARDSGATSIRVRSNISREESHPFYEADGFERRKTQHLYVKRLTADG